ncbi:MAG: hypothetical protein RR177_01345 [Oscillospiraceae bacterium]
MIKVNNENGEYGRFLTEKPASYEITSLDMEVPWEYIYQNRDVLLRVDQFGPVNSQAIPPQDIMLFKREKDDRFSKWLTWISCDKINNGVPFTNFFRPVVSGNPEIKPDKLSITFAPEQATYYYEYQGVSVTTRFFIPNEGTDIVMKIAVKNSEHEELSFSIIPTLVPYVNPAQLAPWDKAEWYLKSGFGIDKELIFWSQLFNASSVKEKRRAVSLWSSGEGVSSMEISLEKFFGSGDTSNPAAIYKNALRLSAENCKGYGVYTDQNQIYGYPPVYASKYDVSLKKGEQREITQVLSMMDIKPDYELPSIGKASEPLCYFDDKFYDKKVEERKEFYDNLFAIRTIETNDAFFDHYVNTWLPLQMDWVASLDRGWPTGMRGSRDCANDFMGELYLDETRTKEIIGLLFQCQRTDGWFPRQISTNGRKGNHDLREFVDAGCFALEMLNEYLCVTGDFKALDEKLPWLDNDDESTLFEHSVKAVNYYINPENIGEHGLCKIRGGDWLDAVNRAGLKGNGETVMVTNQVIMAIQFVINISEKTNHLLLQKDIFKAAKENFALSIKKYAYNEKGFFNSVYTDNGEWVFSDKDPDGECRPYICSNAYSIISGVADKYMQKTAIAAMDTLKCETGYRLFYPGIGKKPIENVGRSGSGDGPIGLFENATPYNHGSHGFLARSLAVAGEADKLLEVLKFMLPYDQEKHATAQALNPPYAIVNCWQRIPGFMNRGGMMFLTGTIAMSLRLIYNWMLGIHPALDALELDPCVARDMGDVNVSFQLRGKSIKLILKNTGKKSLPILNDEIIETTRTDEFSKRNIAYIPYNKLAENNVLIMEI